MSNYRSIGTLVTDVDLTKADSELTRRERIEKSTATQKWSQQGVYDEKGRARFHGAFKGGFSAGYYNTVGSKEGFTPKSYVSSRTSRAAPITQSIADFMDEEDMEDMKLGSSYSSGSFTTSAAYATTNNEQDRRKAALKMAEGSAIPGPVPDELFISSHDSIGYKLLKLMGWREGRPIGSRRRSTNEDDDQSSDLVEPSVAPVSDSKMHVFERKSDTYGLGYDPFRFAPEFSKKKIGSTDFSASKNRIKMGSLFSDPGAAEDDMIYGGSSMMNYDQELDLNDFEEEESVLNIQPISAKSNLRSKKSTKKTDNNNQKMQSITENISECEFSNFVKALHIGDSTPYFEPPKVPSDFNPFHKFSENRPNALEFVLGLHPKDSSSTDARPTSLTATQRSLLLDEELLPQNRLISVQDVPNITNKASEQNIDSIRKPLVPSLQSRFTSAEPILANNTSKLVPSTREAIVPSSTSNLGSKFVKIDFREDPQKQSRYERWIRIKRGQEPEPTSSEDWGDGIDQQQRIQEHSEFSRAWGNFSTPLNPLMAKRFVSSVDSAQKSSTANSGEELHDEAARAGMFGKLTRRIDDWTPTSLLCKRMGIMDPVRASKFQFGSSKPKINQATKEGSAQLHSPTFIEESKKSWQASWNSQNIEPAAALEEDTSMVHERSQTGEASDDAPPVQRPPIDLFKAIFEDDSEEDDSIDNDNDDLPTIMKTSADEIVEQDEKLSAAHMFLDKISPILKTSDRNEPEAYEGPALPPSLHDEHSDSSSDSSDSRRHKHKEKRKSKHKHKHKDKHKHKHKHKEHSKKRSRGDDADPPSKKHRYI